VSATLGMPVAKSVKESVIVHRVALDGRMATLPRALEREQVERLSVDARSEVMSEWIWSMSVPASTKHFVEA
jgi:hypothetical protein